MTKNEEPSSTIEPALKVTSAPRDIKRVTPVIGESIKLVANQLLQSTKEPVQPAAIVEDTRTPPKMKTQIANKNKTKPKLESPEQKIENSHAGIALPITMEDLEKETSINSNQKETSTSHEGISTWILLSSPSSTVKPENNPSKYDTNSSSEDTQKKPKPNKQNKPKKPQPSGNKTPAVKRPIIASSNKSDLVASGSAMNENVFNKIKATVLANVQKNKNAALNRTTTIAPSTTAPITVTLITKNDLTTKAPTTAAIVVDTATEKVSKKKKKNKNKNKTNVVNKESSMLPMEPKEQEIELEVSTPPTTTKKPKRLSNKRKKNKTKKRKTTSTKTSETISETKIRNSTKVSTPSIDAALKPIGTQIYNYLSREVMPTVGVGIVGLAGLVGLASYFLFPFAGPVRRTLEVDKKDDLYRHNAEEYANDGNGQAEEEMLGTVLAGMPANSNNRVNPYVNQTPVRQQTKKEVDQNLRYRHVSTNSDINNYNTHYSQQKTGIAHAAVYSDPISYNTQYENKNVYPMEHKHTVYSNENTNAYHAYSPVEPIYAVPQTGPSGPSSYGNDKSNTVVYGMKPTDETDFEPVYPFEGQVFSETTINPMTYPPTSMYLGSNNESEQPSDFPYHTDINPNDDKHNQFVVGNVPKELVQPVTPAVVPEHGPRKLDRKRRNITKRSLVDSLEEILRAAKKEHKDDEISNEIDEALGLKPQNNTSLPTQQTPTLSVALTDVTQKLGLTTNTVADTQTKNSNKDKIVTPLYPVYTVYPEQKGSKNTIGINTSITESSAEFKTTTSPQRDDEIVESISTMPFETRFSEEITTTESYGNNDVDYSTKTFKVYEVFPSSTQQTQRKTESTTSNPESDIKTPAILISKTVTVTSFVSETGAFSTTNSPSTTNKVSNTSKPKISEKPVKYSTPNVPYYTSTGIQPKPDSSFFGLLKRLVEFKFRLGMSLLQTTSDSLTRYLKSMESTVQRVAKASETQYNYHQ